MHPGLRVLIYIVPILTEIIAVLALWEDSAPVFITSAILLSILGLITGIRMVYQIRNDILPGCGDEIICAWYALLPLTVVWSMINIICIIATRASEICFRLGLIPVITFSIGGLTTGLSGITQEGTLCEKAKQWLLALVHLTLCLLPISIELVLLYFLDSAKVILAFAPVQAVFAFVVTARAFTMEARNDGSFARELCMLISLFIWIFINVFISWTRLVILEWWGHLIVYTPLFACIFGVIMGPIIHRNMTRKEKGDFVGGKIHLLDERNLA